jgi:hypothetical protein
MAVCKSVTIPGMTGHVRRNTHSAFSDLKGPCGAVAAGVISGFIAYLNGFMSTFLLAVAFSFIGPLVVVALIVIFSVFMSMINEMLIAMATTGCAAARGR